MSFIYDVLERISINEVRVYVGFTSDNGGVLLHVLELRIGERFKLHLTAIASTHLISASLHIHEKFFTLVNGHLFQTLFSAGFIIFISRFLRFHQFTGGVVKEEPRIIHS